jgi:hypothetical protein
MATQIGSREQPLNVVVAPGSPAAAAFRSSMAAAELERTPSLDLRFFGGRTLPSLAFKLFYLERWATVERTQIDGALAAAMADPGLNDVVGQVFPGERVESTFVGSSLQPADVDARVDRRAVESLVPLLHVRTQEVACVLLPRGTVVVYYTVAVYSEDANGLVAFADAWQNVCATLYHELQEVRTDPDVEDAIDAGNTPAAARLLGWYSPEGGEIGDIPISTSRGRLGGVMREVQLADGGGTVPVQLMWSNRVDGPEGPATSWPA